MKIGLNKKEIVDALRSFSINFSVASFALAVFEDNIIGYFSGFISLLAIILFCIYIKTEDK